MLLAFFAQAAVSPGRQRTFRGLVFFHLLLVAAGFWLVDGFKPSGRPLLGHLLLVAGIVEGGLLIGWRLTQLPKSQALEFLFVSPMRPWQVFAGEASVGIGRLALITSAGLPLLLLLILEGRLEWLDLATLLVMPFTWGVLAGLSLITWAYEPATIRRWGERVMLGLIVLYLLVGVLAGERLRDWLEWLFPAGSGLLLAGFEALHRNSPFAVLQVALEGDSRAALDRLVVVQLLATAVSALLFLRAANRLQGHFHDLHYRPAIDESGQVRAQIGDEPLRWWAVKRVTQYSGRVNLWLASGFVILYALYTLAGSSWPPWLGRQVFQIFDGMGGIPVVAAALVVLAAVPAAFQYGLWDSNAQDRCRRLELLLLTRLGARDYWEAAAAAAWRRGRGYFALAVLLGAAYAVAGPIDLSQAFSALAVGVVLWGLYFTVGFEAFVRGRAASSLGLLLTLGIPLLAIGFGLAGVAELAALTPPGGVFASCSGRNAVAWLPGFLLSGLVTLGLARSAQKRCEGQLRRWYERHHGALVVE